MRNAVAPSDQESRAIRALRDPDIAEIIGFFSIVPVNRVAKDLLDKNEFGPDQFTSDYILKNRNDAAAIYVGGIAAQLGHRGTVLAYLVKRMMFVIAEGHREIYTRPFTNRGLKLAEQYGFRAVSSSGIGEAYRFNFEEMDDRLADSERAERFLRMSKSRRRGS